LVRLTVGAAEAATVMEAGADVVITPLLSLATAVRM
jgi:hypothetical protein